VHAAKSCSVCGAGITQATSFISDGGVLCATCFGRWETEQRAAQSAASAKDAAQLLKASRLGKLHGVNWAVAIILLAGWVHMPAWLSTTLIAAVLALSFAMRFRSRLAFRAALVLDTVGALAFLAVSVSQLRDSRLLLLAFPVVFGWWLGFLTWRARDAFAAAAPSRE
jgi:hypothetical protein